MEQFNYYGFFIDEETKEFLLNTIESFEISKINKILNSKSANIYLDHCTLLHKSQDWAYDLIPTLESLLDKKITILITGIGYSNKALAFRLEDIPDLCANEIPHITIATYGTGKPVDSNYIEEWIDMRGIFIDGTIKKA